MAPLKSTINLCVDDKLGKWTVFHLALDMRCADVRRKAAMNARLLYSTQLRVCDSDMMKLCKKATLLKISANATCCSRTEKLISSKMFLIPTKPRIESLCGIHS